MPAFKIPNLPRLALQAFPKNFGEYLRARVIWMKTVAIEKLTLSSIRGQQRSPVEELSTFNPCDLLKTSIHGLEMFWRTWKVRLINRQKSQHKNARTEYTQSSEQFSLVRGESFQIHQRLSRPRFKKIEPHLLF